MTDNKDRFKFRAWNYCIKEPSMIYDVQQLSGYSANCFPRKDKKSWNNTLEDIYGNSRDFQNLINTMSYVVMQCTSLKDKNGKLIYEGDIIEYKDVYDNKYQEVISFDNSITGFAPFTYPEYCNIESNSEEYKIVGNKYENPELIENAK